MKPSPEKKPEKFEPGTIWQLGEHRLAYGDCRDKELVGKLIGKDEIALIEVDVPYGVSVAEAKRDFKALTKDKAIANDHLQSDEEYRAFTQEWLNAVKPYLARKNSCYIFNADRMVFALREGMLASGFKLAQLLVWVKSSAVIGRLDYAPAHELIVYGWYGVHEFHHSTDKTVMYYPKPKKSPYHPTTKPLGLIRRLILNSSKIGDAVYDGCLGSGTTLLACEQVKRRCFAVEIDEEYCRTIIQRFERLTGIKAKCIT